MAGPTPVGAPSSGTGMSRAAKRRSKKRERQQQQQELQPAEDLDEERPRVSRKKPLLAESGDTKRTAIRRHEDDDKSAIEDDEVLSSSEESVPKSKAHAVRNGASGGNFPVPFGVHRLVQLIGDDINEATDGDVSASDRAKYILSFLLNMPLDEFYTKYFEKKPLLVQSMTNRNRLDGLLSLASIRQTFDQHALFYGKDINVTRYELQKDGIKRRTTLDPSTPESDPKPVDRSIWSDYYDSGCTIRLLCPHKHNDAVHALLSHLETEFGCMVGANAYLTPPDGSQGFAPHYDDIDAFCLQLEGKKRWKVYAPLNMQDRLPRTSSEDFVAKDLDGLRPALDVVLEPGDVLYFPRGWVHQACTLPQAESRQERQHSLHLTISTMQQWAWIDLMEIVFPEALQGLAMGESTVLRQGLPLNFLGYMGTMHDSSDNNVPELLKRKEDDSVDPDTEAKKIRKEHFCAEAKRRIALVAKEAVDLLDAACDQLGVRFLAERLPPAFTPKERAQTEAGHVGKFKILPSSFCRMARPGIARLTTEDGKAILYHCNDNSRVYMERQLSPMEFEMDDAPAIEQLLTTTDPHWILVEDLFHDSIEDKVAVAQTLFDEGILAVHS